MEKERTADKVVPVVVQPRQTARQHAEQNRQRVFIALLLLFQGRQQRFGRLHRKFRLIQRRIVGQAVIILFLYRLINVLLQTQVFLSDPQLFLRRFQSDVITCRFSRHREHNIDQIIRRRPHQCPRFLIQTPAAAPDVNLPGSVQAGLVIILHRPRQIFAVGKIIVVITAVGIEPGQKFRLVNHQRIARLLQLLHRNLHVRTAGERPPDQPVQGFVLKLPVPAHGNRKTFAAAGFQSGGQLPVVKKLRPHVIGTDRTGGCRQQRNQRPMSAVHFDPPFLPLFFFCRSDPPPARSLISSNRAK